MTVTPWTSKAFSKANGLRLLAERQLPVPKTFTLPAGDLRQAPTILQEIKDTGAEWILRADAAPNSRFSIKTGKLPAIEPLQFIERIGRSMEHEGVIVIQRMLKRRIDGAALRNANGLTIVEVQSAASSGNFFRDGSTPHRWVMTRRRDMTTRAEGLPVEVVNALEMAFDRLPVPSCLEWVLDDETGAVFFVDAKTVGSEFLDKVKPTIQPGEGVPLWTGVARGRLTVAGSGSQSAGGDHILLAEKTSLEVLANMNRQTRGLVFRDGGLLSHAAVYATECRVPMMFLPKALGVESMIGSDVNLIVDDGQYSITAAHA